MAEGFNKYHSMLVAVRMTIYYIHHSVDMLRSEVKNAHLGIVEINNWEHLLEMPKVLVEMNYFVIVKLLWKSDVS
jgi:hypothetical protein